MKFVSGYRSLDLTTCEVCGMWWTAAKHELCPRCDLAMAIVRLEETNRRVEEILQTPPQGPR